MWLINLLKKRPSDMTIRMIKIILGVIYIASLSYFFFVQEKGLDSEYFWFINVPEDKLIIVKCIFIALGIVPILFGLFNICLFKSGPTRIFQILYGIIIIYVSCKIEESSSLGIPELITLIGIFDLLAGISGKLLTTKASKYGYKVEKIRV